MDQVGRYVFIESNLADKAIVLGNALAYIARRVIAILALFAFTYGLLAAEVELARLEQFAASPHTSPVEHVRDHW